MKRTYEPDPRPEKRRKKRTTECMHPHLSGPTSYRNGCRCIRCGESILPPLQIVTCPDCNISREVRYPKGTSGRCLSCTTFQGVRLTCPNCRKEFTRSPGYMTKLKGSQTELFCSKACRKQGGGYAETREKISQRMQGMNAPNYKHGKSINHSKWNVRLKGEDACRNCHTRQGRLHLHHAIPRSKYREGKTELLNGIPLCMACHMKWHHHSMPIYRDIFTDEEWEWMCSVKLTGENIEPWLDRYYPTRP